MFYLGIDVAMNTHRLLMLDDNGERASDGISFQNNTADFEKVLSKLKELSISSDNAICGLEATGNNWENLYCYLIGNGFKVIVINPHQTNKFREVFPTAKHLSLTKPKHIEKIVRSIKGNNFNIKEIENLISAAKTSVYSGRCQESRALTLNILLTQVENFGKSIQQTEEQINLIFSPTSNDDINSFPGSNPLSIPGIGPKTLAAILSCVGENGQAFTDGVKLIGHIGFFSQIYESGETRRANKLSTKGPAYLRHALYVASVACIKHNLQLRSLYHKKISQGKKPKQALICVAKKLAHTCLSMLHSGQDYNPARVFSYV